MKLESETALVDHFDNLHASNTDNYLKKIHKPRAYAEDTYEDQLLLKGMKEIETGFPFLKRSYERFDQHYDKWISNDGCLAMGIDGLIKRLQVLLNEIAAMKQKDSEDAFLIYIATFTSFTPLSRANGTKSESDILTFRQITLLTRFSNTSHPISNESQSIGSSIKQKRFRRVNRKKTFLKLSIKVFNSYSLAEKFKGCIALIS